MVTISSQKSVVGLQWKFTHWNAEPQCFSALEALSGWAPRPSPVRCGEERAVFLERCMKTRTPPPPLGTERKVKAVTCTYNLDGDIQEAEHVEQWQIRNIVNGRPRLIATTFAAEDLAHHFPPSFVPSLSFRNFFLHRHGLIIFSL